VTNKTLNIYDQVTLSDSTLAIFLGYQDDKRFGFFRQISKADTFFGWEIAKTTLKAKPQMTIEKTCQILKRFNRWRRGAEIKQPCPKQIGLAIESAIKHLKSIKSDGKTDI
jgi:hypothetical protein